MSKCKSAHAPKYGSIDSNLPIGTLPHKQPLNKTAYIMTHRSTTPNGLYTYNDPWVYDAHRLYILWDPGEMLSHSPP